MKNDSSIFTDEPTSPETVAEGDFGYVNLEHETFPPILVIAVTNLCNMACIHCAHPVIKKDPGYRGTFMKPEVHRAIVEQVRDYKDQLWVFRYAADGESLLHPQFLDFVEETKAAGIGPVDLTTWAYALARPPRSGPGLRAWLAKVARNFIRQDRRGRGRRRKREAATAKPERLPDTEGAVARERARRRVVDAVLDLEEPYRSVVVLRYLEDLPPREIAKRTGAPVETVRTRIKRALGRLRDRFDGEHDGSVAVAETRLEGVKDHVCLRVSHKSILVSRDVVEQAAAFLKHGEFLR